MKRVTRLAFLSAFGLLAVVPDADAQSFGPFRWQLLPYCNVVTLTVTPQGGAFGLAGFDDQCGAGQRASVVGAAFFNPDGTIGIGLSTVTTASGRPVHIDARISPATLHGPWSDSVRNTGSFVFTPGPGIAGPPRPAPSASITREFPLGLTDWVGEQIGSEKFRRAVISIPEITQAVVDSGSIRGFVQVFGLADHWSELPFLTLNGATTIVIFSSYGLGQVTLRVRASDNGDYSPQAQFKVIVTP